MSRPPDFDRVARVYRWCEYLALGRSLEHTRNTWLGHLQASRRVLVLGDGDGRFTALLLHLYPQIQVTAVDGSAVMLRLLQRRCAVHAQRLQTIQADIRSFAPAVKGQPFDLVVTHFFLDCLTPAEVQRLPAQLAPALTADCRWLLSEFAIPPGVLALPARVYIRLLYLAFQLLTGLRARRLPDYAAALTEAGWQPQECSQRLGGLLTAQLWSRLG